MEQAPVQIGQFILGKNLGIGAFGKVRTERGNGYRGRMERAEKRHQSRDCCAKTMDFTRYFTRTNVC